MIRIKILVATLSMLSLTACVGPLLSHDVARSVGDGNHNLKLIAATEDYFGVSYDYGLTANWDLGIQMEALNLGLRTKYAFINKKKGFSFAGQLGYGATFGGSYTTAALLTSYAAKKWEPFASIRYTTVSIDALEFTDEDTDDVFLSTPAVDFSYYQAFVGTKYWFAKWFGLSLEAGFISSDEDEVEFDADAYYSIAMDFMF